MVQKLLRRNRLYFVLLYLLICTGVAFALPDSDTLPKNWSKSAQWLYGALTARFEDQAGKYTSALNAVADIAVESREYDALEYSYGLAWDTRNLPRAEKIARTWLSAFPRNNEARLALLHVLLIEGRSNEALSQMSQLLHLDSGAQNAAQIFRSLTDFPDADARLSLLQKLSSEFPGNAYLHYYVGVMAKEQGKVSTAMEAFNKAIALDANWRELELLQAQVLSSIGKLADARKIMNKMRRRYPGDTAILSAYIDMLTAYYQWSDALQLALQWQAINPDDTGVRQLVARLYGSAGDYSNASKQFKQLWEEQRIDTDNYYFSIAHAAIQAKLYDTADKILAKINPDSAWYLRAQEQRALLCVKQHDFVRAKERFQKLRQDFPDDAQILDTYLIEAAQLQQARRWKELDKLLQEALQRYPDQVDLLYVLAEYKISLGKLADARKEFEKILQIDPANTDALNAYGYLLLTQTNEKEYATKLIGEAIQAYPDSPAVQDSYGWLLFSQGHTEKALLWLRRAYAAYRNNEIVAHYIEALYAAGDHALAKEVFHYEKQGQPNNSYLQNIGKKLGFLP